MAVARSDTLPLGLWLKICNGLDDDNESTCFILSIGVQGHQRSGTLSDMVSCERKYCGRNWDGAPSSNSLCHLGSRHETDGLDDNESERASTCLSGSKVIMGAGNSATRSRESRKHLTAATMVVRQEHFFRQTVYLKRASGDLFPHAYLERASGTRSPCARPSFGRPAAHHTPATA